MNERMDTNENRTRILIESICSLTLIIYCALAVTFYKAHVIVRSQNVCHRCIGIVFRSSTRVLLEKYRSIDVQSSSYYSIEQYWPMISKNVKQCSRIPRSKIILLFIKQILKHRPPCKNFRIKFTSFRPDIHFIKIHVLNN